MDKISLFNMALHKLGDREYYRDTPSGKECDLWFPQVYHDALSFGAWTFATKNSTLKPINPATYALPEDCIRLLVVSAPHYTIQGREITLTSTPLTDTLDIRYISNDLATMEAIPDQEPKFTHALTLLLASRIAMKITSQPQLSMALEQQANEALRDALHSNVIQHASNDQHPLLSILNSSLF